MFRILFSFYRHLRLVFALVAGLAFLAADYSAYGKAGGTDYFGDLGGRVQALVNGAQQARGLVASAETDGPGFTPIPQGDPANLPIQLPATMPAMPAFGGAPQAPVAAMPRAVPVSSPETATGGGVPQVRRIGGGNCSQRAGTKFCKVSAD